MEPQTLLDVSGAVPESVTQSLLQACRTRTVSSVQAAIIDAIADGWGVRACFLSCLLFTAAADVNVPFTYIFSEHTDLKLHKGPMIPVQP